MASERLVKLRPLLKLSQQKLSIRFLTSYSYKNNCNYKIGIIGVISNTRHPQHHPYLHLHSTNMSAPQSDAATPPSSAPIKTVRVIIKGRVQGVFFRDWTVENATQLGLNGWVRNRRDRSVEAIFSGKPDALEEMGQRCRRGPPDAIVTALEVFPTDEDPGTGFERRPTT